ncbi:MAG: cysteine desulfurase family protein [Candidatus Neomarinimicrobiota bacterium]
MNKKPIYLDHNATTPLHPEVKKALTEMMEIYGNPSSLHSDGREARRRVEDAREKTATFINARPDEIIFVGSGSEANNTVLSMMSCPSNQCQMTRKMRNAVVTTKIEHPCILESSKCLKERGTPVTYIDVDEFGKIDPDNLRKKLNPNIGLVSIIMANNEIGTVQDIKTFAEIAHQNGSLFHTDAVQAVGKITVDVKALNVDFLTISAHKMYGPKGIGALYVKHGIPFCPLIRGGHQEMGRRAGTENTLGIVGLGKAIEMRKIEMESEEKRLLELKKILRAGIEKSIPDIKFNGHPTDCLPGTLNVSFDGAEGESILLYLDLEGIEISTGSACASGSLDPSHVLLATGLSAERAHGSVRISLGRENTVDEMQYVVKTLEEVIRRIRSMSTIYGRNIQ